MAGYGKNLSEIFNKFSISQFKKVIIFFTVFVLVVGIFMVVSGRFYDWLDSAKMFGLKVSRSAQNGTDFIKINNIQGPVFNNFDIGSYLVWQLYPNQKVFVEGRPEAYPVGFLKIFINQCNATKRFGRKCLKNTVSTMYFFAHTDMTEWGEEFLTRISKDKEWPMVFLNDSAVVFLKNADLNRPIIDKHKITEDNVSIKIPQILSGLDKNDDNAFVNFGNALYRFRWLAGSAVIFETLIKISPIILMAIKGWDMPMPQ